MRASGSLVSSGSPATRAAPTRCSTPPDPGQLVGTVEQVAERLDAYRAAGVSGVMLQHLDHRDLEMVRVIGEQLAPAVAGRG